MNGFNKQQGTNKSKSTLQEITKSYLDWKYDNLEKNILNTNNSITTSLLNQFRHLYRIESTSDNVRILEARDWHYQILLQTLDHTKLENETNLQRLGGYIYSIMDFFELLSSQFYAILFWVESVLRQTLIDIRKLDHSINEYIITQEIYLQKHKKTSFQKVTFSKLISLYESININGNSSENKDSLLIKALKHTEAPKGTRATSAESGKVTVFLRQLNYYRNKFFHPETIKFDGVFLENYFNWLVENEGFIFIENFDAQTPFNELFEKQKNLISDVFVDKINDIRSSPNSNINDSIFIVDTSIFPTINDESKLEIVNKFWHYVKPWTFDNFDFFFLKPIINRVEVKTSDLLHFISHFEGIRVNPKDLRGVIRMLIAEIRKDEQLSSTTLLLVRHIFLSFNTRPLIKKYDPIEENLPDIKKHLKSIQEMRNCVNHFTSITDRKRDNFFIAIDFFDINHKWGTAAKEELRQKKLEVYNDFLLKTK